MLRIGVRGTYGRITDYGPSLQAARGRAILLSTVGRKEGKIIMKTVALRTVLRLLDDAGTPLDSSIVGDLIIEQVERGMMALEHSILMEVAASRGLHGEAARDWLHGGESFVAQELVRRCFHDSTRGVY